MLLAMIFSTAPRVEAHAKLLRSEPARGEKLEKIPAAVALIFSEKIQATDLNSIVVKDSNGGRVDRQELFLSEDGKKLSVALSDKASGRLNVEWKALSADNHLIKGRFFFTVLPGQPTPTIEAPEVAEIPQAAAEPPSEIQPEPPPPLSTNFNNPLQSLVRWLTYLVLMLIFGGFAFLITVFEPVLRYSDQLSLEEKMLASGLALKRSLMLTALSAAMLLLCAFLALVLQTSTVLEINLSEGFLPTNFIKILTQTEYGFPWIAQIFLGAAILSIVFFLGRGRKNEPPREKKTVPALLWMGLALSTLLLAAMSLSGHARAAQREYWFAVPADWLHLVAAGFWVGGIFQMALILPGILRGLEGFKKLFVLNRLIGRFGGWAVVSTMVLAATGFYNSWIHLKNWSDLFETPYGVVLLVKIILFLLILPLGAVNRFVIRPRIEKLSRELSETENPGAIRDFYFVLRLEAAFAAMVLLLAAILAFLPHARDHHAGISGGGGLDEAAAYKIRRDKTPANFLENGK